MEHTFLIEGMHCGGCVASVERVLNAQAGVQRVAVSLADKRAIVTFDPARTNIPALQAAIEAVGYAVLG
ncbi:heavy-metal-associated domain-containing protein [Chitinimonas sp. BJB300]|uniref:heavy-metal-associated domain-containing protein n=1 Tax=Chitinimonas sp. BJB300 TaxID=1559339 RepID=UPI000C0EF0A2|nr:heavy-metal-associated domain-containing protein [Chitinimonas sp. BJB300]PHV10327.1 copper resistance protein CopZ [Chitinimonas sp. BJB300]TSJ91622.1 heavy-metal-associated domain-containing protein [Chitinimonas sp. BJB300]